MPPECLSILGNTVPYTVVHDREYFGRSRHIMFLLSVEGTYEAIERLKGHLRFLGAQ